MNTSIQKGLWFFGLLTAATIVAYTATLKNTSSNPNISQTPQSGAEVLTELDQTEIVAISELLLEEYEHAAKLIKTIQNAGARVLVFSKDPINPSLKKEWFAKYELSDEDASKMFTIPVIHNSYWVKDFSPIPVKLQPDLFNRYFLSDFRYRREDNINDAVSYQIALYLNLNLIRAPLIMDGGNFVSNGDTCIITSDSTLEEAEDNNNQENEVSREHLKKTFKNYFGCKMLHVIEEFPHEHIDMFAKFIDRNTILINDIELPNSGDDRFSKNDSEQSHKYKQQLDEIAKQLAPHFKVVRLPMLPITNGIFRTYANSLLVNSTAIVPSYKVDKVNDKSFPDIDKISAYESRVEKIMNTYGYKTAFVNSDELIARGGAIHCVTSQLPLSVQKLAHKK